MGESLLNVLSIYFLFVIVTLCFFYMLSKVTKFEFRGWLIIVVALVPFLVYVPTEIRTAVHGDKFSDISEHIELDVIYYKVLSIDDESAEILTVEGMNDEHLQSNEYLYKMIDGEWEFIRKDRIYWSEAERGNVIISWPPYF